jgi:L-histidine Nalpha-methyltransferase
MSGAAAGRVTGEGAPAALDEDFATAVLEGLSSEPKYLLSKHLYDAEGSALFERITTLEDYYPTRTELAILRENAHRLAEVLPEGAALVEPGAGSGEKTRVLLDALPGLAAYVPVDISGDHLEAAAERLRQDYPRLAVLPVVGDFSRGIALPEGLGGAASVVFFPGSTIGNFTKPAAAALLARFREVPRVAALVIGVDLVKDPVRLVRAYDDCEGVTAAFNLNLLARINRELGGDFDLAGFAHEARWNESERRIEMHLRSLRRQSVRAVGRRFEFAEGETIHTENSHKYTVEGFREIAASAGWRPVEAWVDREGLFSLHLLTP